MSDDKLPLPWPRERIPVSDLRVGDVLPLRGGNQIVDAIKIEGDVLTAVLRHEPRGLRAPLSGTITIRTRT